MKSLHLTTILLLIALLASLCAPTGLASEPAPTNEIVLTDEIIIGCWCEDENWGEEATAMHNFYSDGTYRYYYSRFDRLEPRYYLEGTWELEEDTVRLYLTLQVVREGGEYICDVDIGHYRSGGENVEYHLEPAMERSFDASSIFWDDEGEDGGYHRFSYMPYLPASLSIYIDDVQYWKLEDVPWPRNEEEKREMLKHDNEENYYKYIESMPDRFK